jgi:hypothetical protein
VVEASNGVISRGPLFGGVGKHRHRHRPSGVAIEPFDWFAWTCPSSSNHNHAGRESTIRSRPASEWTLSSLLRERHRLIELIAAWLGRDGRIKVHHVSPLLSLFSGYPHNCSFSLNIMTLFFYSLLVHEFPFYPNASYIVYCIITTQVQCSLNSNQPSQAGKVRHPNAIVGPPPLHHQSRHFGPQAQQTSSQNT